MSSDTVPMYDRYPIPGVGQVPAELDRLRALYRQTAPKTVLEIGVWWGGTLREWLTHAVSDATVVVIDVVHHAEAEYGGWRRPDTNLVVGHGMSQSPDILALIRQHAPYDWVFIDGDHEESGVRADVDNLLPLVSPGGLLLLHDIYAAAEDESGLTGPRIVFDEQLLHDGSSVDEIVEHDPGAAGYPTDSGHGIGIVQP